MGPARINDDLKIPYLTPNENHLMFLGDPGTGKLGKNTLSAIAAMIIAGTSTGTIIISENANPTGVPAVGKLLYFRADTGQYWISFGGTWQGPFGGTQFRGEWDASVDRMPNDADALGSGAAGALRPGDRWSLSEGGDLDSGDGEGVRPVNKYAIIEYIKPGLWHIYG